MRTLAGVISPPLPPANRLVQFAWYLWRIAGPLRPSLRRAAFALEQIILITIDTLKLCLVAGLIVFSATLGFIAAWRYARHIAAWLGI